MGNRWQLEHFKLDDFDRQGIGNLELYPGDDGPLWKSVFMRGSSELAPDPNGVEIEIRLYRKEPLIEFRYRLRKRSSTDPESLYAAFPFGDLPEWLQPDGSLVLRFDSAGSQIAAASQQLPRTSSDWHAANNFVEVERSNYRYHLSSPEIFLHQFGDIQLGKFRESPTTDKPHVYSWLFNNYWVTNFLADQNGELTWTQSIRGSYIIDCDLNNHFQCLQLARSSWGQNSPMPTRVLPPNARSQHGRSYEGQYLSWISERVALVNARPVAGDKVLLQLREIHGWPSNFRIQNGDGQEPLFRRADAVGRPMDPQDEALSWIYLSKLANLHLLVDTKVAHQVVD